MGKGMGKGTEQGKGTGNRFGGRCDICKKGTEQVRSEKTGSRKGKETSCIERKHV
jgi:hypothetical protein